MAHPERIRDVVTGSLDLEHMKRRMEEGWTLTALEWQRGAPESQLQEFDYDQDVPYGVRVAADCRHLEEDPTEVSILMLMMGLLISDKSFSEVARELNEAGHRTRSGVEWSPVSVFNMLPRLIDMGPRIFSREDWEVRKRKLLRPV